MDNINTYSSLDNVMTNQNHLLMDLIPSREDSTSFPTMLPWNSIRQDPLQMGVFDIFNSFLTNKYLSSTSRSTNVHETSFEAMAPPPSLHPMDHLRPYDDPSNNMWSLGENSEFHAYPFIEGVVGPSEPIISTFGEEFPRNEFSLSLATDVSDECSEISLCAATKSTRITSEQASSSSKDMSNVSQVIFCSKYLHSVQEILSHFATYSLKGLETNPQCYFSSRGTESEGTNSAFTSCYENLNEFLDGGSQRQALEAKKTHLLDLLQMVDDRYSHCVDEIHTVVSAFHAATELDPQLHTRFALQTISFLYKNLRERISKKILMMGSVLERGKEKSQEDSIFHQHCLLQQLKRKTIRFGDRNEVCLRNQSRFYGLGCSKTFFTPKQMILLYSYPKDSEKHLLAIRSGLTRSQVSNWFINARVRLWKPMIEDMYAEMNKRKLNNTHLQGGSTDRNQIYEINDYGQENAVLYSEHHDAPRDFGSVSSLAGGKGFNQDAAILHLGYGTEEAAICGVFDGYGVIATPQVSTHQITPRDQFLLLASDGVWDVLSNEEVATVVMKSTNEAGAVKAVTEVAANARRQKYPTAKVHDISVVCLYQQETNSSAA
ncbi:hypothetical protein Bca52824_089565 [Brassica carinata]|uniref:Homeobox domain-containing protein n=1 Tax=Brassica carinata TaxID=52824 RepID=A0A8X7PFF0_BRACI|nr:hypothetical protein Bca52824_089565 [Brassica carinata]